MSIVDIEAPSRAAGPAGDAADFESLLGALIEATEEENIDISGCIACGGCMSCVAPGNCCALPCNCNDPRH
ncbi:hypothetical protein [Microbacterium sp. NPDC055599]